MRIKYVTGDLLKTPLKAILHGCNAKGVMGAGVALQIKEHFPLAYSSYRDDYMSHGLNLGEIIVVPARSPFDAKMKYILNAVTQLSYGKDAKFVDYPTIKSVIQSVDCMVQPLGIDSVAMPKIGAGYGGGDWEIISQIIEENAKKFEPWVYIPD